MNFVLYYLFVYFNKYIENLIINVHITQTRVILEHQLIQYKDNPIMINMLNECLTKLNTIEQTTNRQTKTELLTKKI